jgi:MFS family permease
MLFYFEKGIYITLIAALLLGISTSLVIASQSSFLLGLEVTKKFGEGKALGIFRATSRAGQAAGPIIFSFIFLGENINYNMAFIGLFYLLTSFIFLLISKNNGQIIIKE